MGKIANMLKSSNTGINSEKYSLTLEQKSNQLSYTKFSYVGTL
jgi:hypothetical protein